MTTERSNPIDHESEGRLRIIGTFKNNFKRFLDEEKPTIKLISLLFVPEMDEPTISNHPVHIKYNGIDKEFEKVIEKYRKSGSEPMHIPEDTFKLAEFERMSDRLRTYVGREIKALATIYDLVSMPNKKAMVTKTTYYLPDDIDCKQPIEETWTAMRSEQHNEPLVRKPKHGSALREPRTRHVLYPKLSLTPARR